MENDQKNMTRMESLKFNLTANRTRQPKLIEKYYEDPVVLNPVMKILNVNYSYLIPAFETIKF